MEVRLKHLFDIHHFSAEVCAQLHQEAFKTRAWSVQSFEASLKLSNVFGKGLRSSPGAFQGFYLAQQADDVGELLTFLVHPLQQRQGYGHILLKDFLTTAQSKRIKHLFLEVSEHNHAALSLYRKVGFQPIGNRPFYYSQVGQIGESALTFRLTF